MVLVTGTLSGIKDISGHTLLFLVLSGLATGASWLCYFHALQKGDINKVVPIDKSSTILTILLALIFLHEGLSWAKAGCVCLIGVGTMMMITRKEVSTDNSGKDGSWLIYAVLSAVFASLTAILGKNRYFRCGFQPWNCNTNDGCVGNGMADGFYERQTA